jgi:hypothetical protein
MPKGQSESVNRRTDKTGGELRCSGKVENSYSKVIMTYSKLLYMSSTYFYDVWKNALFVINLLL